MTLCTNRWCPLARDCYRSGLNAKPVYMQSWSYFQPNDENDCDYFIDSSREDRHEFVDKD